MENSDFNTDNKQTLAYLPTKGYRIKVTEKLSLHYVQESQIKQNDKGKLEVK